VIDESIDCTSAMVHIEREVRSVRANSMHSGCIVDPSLGAGNPFAHGRTQNRGDEKPE
jgi:hypothetical protein